MHAHYYNRMITYLVRKSKLDLQFLSVKNCRTWVCIVKKDTFDHYSNIDMSRKIHLKSVGRVVRILVGWGLGKFPVRLRRGPSVKK